MSKCVLMHFPSFAGGKFIVNCLSLSKHSLVMNGQSVDYLISNPTDYEYRLNEVLSTLPLPENILDWLVTCEFGDDVMYGLDYWKKCSAGLIVEPTDRVLQIANSNMLFFMTVHDIESILGIMNNWKDAFVISLINHVKFQTLSHSLKAVDRIIDNGNVSEKKYNELRGMSWPSWDEFQYIGYNINALGGKYPKSILDEINTFYPFRNITKQYVFDIDSCIFDESILCS